MKIKYNSKLKARASELRKNATLSERILWKYLRNRQVMGYQFMRQKPIENYIVDFYCSRLNLVIEVDGITHNEKHKYDDKREERLTKIGLSVLRFDGHYLMNNINEVMSVVYDKVKDIEQNTTP